MKRIALIKNGVVENVALWEDKMEWKQDVESKGALLVDVTNEPSVGPEYTYDGNTFTPPFYIPVEADDDTTMTAKEIETVVAQVLEQMGAKI